MELKLRIPQLDFFFASLFIVSSCLLDIALRINGLKAGNIALYIVAMLLIFYKFVILKGKYVGFFSKYDIPMLSFVFLAFSSLLWSPSGVQTLFHSCLLLLILVSCILVSSVGFNIVLKFSIQLGVFLCIVSLAMMFLMPSVAFQPISSSSFPELRGVFEHQLRLGVFSGVLAGFILISCRNGDWVFIFGSKLNLLLSALVVFLTLALAAARLYTFFSILSIIIVFFMPAHLIRRYFFGSLVFISFVLIVFNSEFLFQFIDEQGVDATLTGRTLIWEKSIDIAIERPVLGFGYPSFSNEIFDNDWKWYRPLHPHNSFVQAFFELGVLGLITTILWIVSNFLEVLKYYGVHRGGPYILYLFFMAFLGSFTGANYASKPSYLIILMLVFIMSVRYEVKKMKSIRHD